MGTPDLSEEGEIGSPEGLALGVLVKGTLLLAATGACIGSGWEGGEGGPGGGDLGDIGNIGVGFGDGACFCCCGWGVCGCFFNNDKNGANAAVVNNASARLCKNPGPFLGSLIKLSTQSLTGPQSGSPCAGDFGQLQGSFGLDLKKFINPLIALAIFHIFLTNPNSLIAPKTIRSSFQ